MPQKGILLLQMGGPSDLDGVEPFLYNLFNDKYIIQLPSFMQPYQSQFAKFVSSRRAPKVAKLYEEIGGGSPIKFETDCQAKALEKRLSRLSPNGDKPYKVYYAMRYSEPFLKDTLPQMQSDGIDDLTVIPLYPQYSLATSGSSMIECREMFDETGFSQEAKIKYIEEWHDNESFIQLIIRRIQDSLKLFEADGIEDKEKVFILFSAHGLPVKYVRDGDPYQQQVLDSVRLIMGRLPMHKHMVCYQSRVGPVKWLEPSTEDALEHIAKDLNFKNVLVVPISFVGDHIETLQEIGIEYKELAHELGIENFKITRLPKANKLLIDALESLL